MSEARAIYKKGFDLLVEGDHEQAIEQFRAAIGIDDGLAIAWNALSAALAQGGDVDGAIDAAKKLAALEPDDPLSHTNLSRLLQRKGLVPEAEEEMAIAQQLELKQQS